MADHALTLLAAIEAMLHESVPLPDGWHSTPINVSTGTWGNFYITSSTAFRSTCNVYDEQHRGVVSIYDRTAAGGKPNPLSCFTESRKAFDALEAFTIESPNFWLLSFLPSQISRSLLQGTIANVDGITWQASITFTAITREVKNG